MGSCGLVGRWGTVAVLVAIAGVMMSNLYYGGWDKDAALQLLSELSDRLGMWAIPAYVGLHTVTLALCLPYAVFFEAGASLLFGFLPAVLCVFSAKLLGASLSFWIGRAVAAHSTCALLCLDGLHALLKARLDLKTMDANESLLGKFLRRLVE
ncbi:unnamed protein product [Ilex paraguariensis]|uniref:SNARE associated Golgi protein n=1 Tax=Ilex paraguariensis TaxID=185542 RepID=A0ABC8QKZ1_9AQUA